MKLATIEINLNGLLKWRYLFKNIKYGFKIFKEPHRFWFILFTPTWHNKRGPYISIGFWKYGFYRGY